MTLIAECSGRKTERSTQFNLSLTNCDMINQVTHLIPPCPHGPKLEQVWFLRARETHGCHKRAK